MTGRIFGDMRDLPLLQKVRRTETARERAKGLLGSSCLDVGEGLLIVPCNSVHTFFMKYPIDVVFLDHRSRILKIVENLKPYRYAGALRAKGALELQAGAAIRLGLQPGDSLLWENENVDDPV